MQVQFKIKTLMVVALAAAVCLAMYDRFYPFNGLRDGDACSILDAAAYQGIDNFMVHLESPFHGILKCKYIAPRISSGPGQDDIEFSFDSALINSRSSYVSELRPKLELRNFFHKFDTRTSPTVLTDKLPSLSKLKSFTNVSQFVNLLGQQRGPLFGRMYFWSLFKIVDEHEIEVMTISVFGGEGPDDDIELVIHHGLLKTSPN